MAQSANYKQVACPVIPLVMVAVMDMKKVRVFRKIDTTAFAYEVLGAPQLVRNVFPVLDVSPIPFCLFVGSVANFVYQPNAQFFGPVVRVIVV